jgi:acetoin utilization protein AcuB
MANLQAQKLPRLPVDEYTTPSPFVVTPEARITTVLSLMRDHGIRHLPVVSGRMPVGIISDRDVRLLVNVPGMGDLTAGEVMVHDPFTVESGASLESVVLAMARQRIGSSIVTHHGEIVGIFTSTDALNALIEVLRGEAFGAGDDADEGVEATGPVPPWRRAEAEDKHASV